MLPDEFTGYYQAINGCLPASIESKPCLDDREKHWMRSDVSQLMTSHCGCAVSLGHFPSYAADFPPHTADFPPLLFTPSCLQHPTPITPDPQEVDTMDWK